jgi:hypothetical protein
MRLDFIVSFPPLSDDGLGLTLCQTIPCEELAAKSAAEPLIVSAVKSFETNWQPLCRSIWPICGRG